MTQRGLNTTKCGINIFFAGPILMPYSPYSRLIKENAPAICQLPIDVAKLEEQGVEVPDDIRAASAYREFFAILTE